MKFLSAVSQLSPRQIGRGLLACLGLGLLVAVAGPAKASPPSGYVLNWSDEFNGTVGSLPNSANWNYDLGGGGHGNGELETYVQDTAHTKIVADSNATDGLALDVTATNDGGLYHSGRIKTKGQVTATFGYIEYRTIEGPSGDPTGRGIWPANWMLGANIDTVPWPGCGEADIFEDIGQTPFRNVSSLHMTGHSGGSPLSGTYNFPSGQSISSGYHLYAMLWQQDAISFYVDNNLFETHTASEVSAGQWDFNHSFFFVINMAVGGAFPGPPNSGTVFPQDMHVDYVRAYIPNPNGPPPPPLGLGVAFASGSSATITWSQDAIPVTSYSLYRSTVSGGEGSTPFVTGITGLTYTDAGLTSGTTYYYTVAGVNSFGTGGQSNEGATLAGSVQVFGGTSGSIGTFGPDGAFAGASTVAAPVGATIDTTGVTNPAPMAVYQHERFGPGFSEVFPLTANAAYTVRLHFAETYFNTGGARTFNVSINGTQVLTNFDIWTAAGGHNNKAVMKQFTTNADGAGKVTIAFAVGGANLPKIDGIEVLGSGGPPPPPPPTPTGVTATAGDTQVTIAWNASSGANSYNLYRSTVSGGEGTTAVATTAGTSIVNTGLTNGTQYFFTVSASNGGGTSAQSTEVSATPVHVVTAPPAPTGVSATAGNAQVTVAWSASSGATSYSVFRGTAAGGEGTTAVATTTGLSVTDTGLTNGTKYFYKVSATNSAGTSPLSAEVSATPTAPTGGIDIDCGANPAAPFVADTDFSGGVTTGTTHAIDTSLLSAPIPPQSVLQSNRHTAPFTYTIPGFTSGQAVTVTLYFEENFWTAAGKRKFNVAINGTNVLSAFDIFAATGAQFKAISKAFSANANSSGQVVIAFTAGGVDQPICNAISVH